MYNNYIYNSGRKGYNYRHGWYPSALWMPVYHFMVTVNQEYMALFGCCFGLRVTTPKGNGGEAIISKIFNYNRP